MILSKTFSKYRKNPLITGTLLLTVAGVLSRIIGFFYRIFLSRVIGAENIGLYQLTFPILALCLSLTSSGIQTALSRFVAQESRSPARALRYFYTALLLSTALCLITQVFLRQNASAIASSFLGDERCTPLLFIMGYAFIPACVHACINGYYYGMQQATVPSVSQLIEQVARVGGVFLIGQVVASDGGELTALHAMWGVVIGELFGMLYSLLIFWLQLAGHPDRSSSSDTDTLRFSQALAALCSMAIPLTFNRVLMNLCTSVENLLIPKQLVQSGLSQATALSIYGILTGMSLSIILFPNVVTGSLSVLLLPAISEAKAGNREDTIRNSTQKAVRYGLLLGFLFTILFYLLGEPIGSLFFHEPLAGEYIRRICWICPFMFVSGMLGSILHGLGKPKTVLLINLLACLIRISFIQYLVPNYGIHAYLWSLLISWFFCAIASMIPLRRYL